MRLRLFTTALACAAAVFVCAPAAGDVVEISSSDFSVYARGSLIIGQDADITGFVGTHSSAMVGTGVTITGNFFSGGNIVADTNLTVTGRIIADDRIELGEYASVGRLDGTIVGGDARDHYIKVGAHSTTGEIRGGVEVKIENDVTISGDVHAGYKFNAKDDVTVLGIVAAADNVRFGKRGSAGDLHAGRDVDIGDDSVAGNLYATNNVKVRKRAIVNGDIHAGNDAELYENAVVHGNVTYGHGLKLPRDNGPYTIDGQAAQGTPLAPQAPEGPDTWNAALISAPEFQYGTEVLDYAAGQSVDLQPGRYYGLTVGNGATVNLTGGEYEFYEVTLGENVHILVDTTGGDVTIKVADALDFGNFGLLEIVGDGQASVYAGGDLNIGSDSQIDAALFAFDDMLISDNSIIAGSLYADDELHLGSGVVVQGDGIGSPLPEPGAMFLLGVGGVGLLARRRRRSRQL